MSEYFLIAKEKLKDFLKAVMKTYCLVAPQPAVGGDFLFQETKDIGRISLNYDITANSLKEFFFPQREAIFKYEKKKSSFKIVSVKGELKEEIVFLGVRACDVRAVNFQDQFFSQEPKDELYWQKRNKSMIISFACKEPARQSCFCILSGGPCLEKNEGFDLQFIDLAKAYLVEIGTTKGRDLIKKYKRFFSLADKDMQDKKAHLKEHCLRHFKEGYEVMRIYEKLKNKELGDLWEELGKRCTNCGGCEFICPTCFCFYSQDIEDKPGRGQRLRGWDSCTFSGYSRMAGDVNPHEKNSERISRRFFCKLYNCYRWFGVFACTGCGRCSFVCPVNLDMESFISSLIKEENTYQPLLKEL